MRPLKIMDSGLDPESIIFNLIGSDTFLVTCIYAVYRTFKLTILRIDFSLTGIIRNQGTSSPEKCCQLQQGRILSSTMFAHVFWPCFPLFLVIQICVLTCPISAITKPFTNYLLLINGEYSKIGIPVIGNSNN